MPFVMARSRRHHPDPGPGRRAIARWTAISVGLLLLGSCSHTPPAGPTHRTRLLSAHQQSGFRIVGPEGPQGASVSQFREDVDRLVAMGQTWVRYDVPSWVTAPEGSHNRLRWDSSSLERQRAAARYAHDRGLRVMLVTSGAPDWSRPYDFQAYADTTAAYWAGLRDALAPYVDVWQVFNEADTTHYRTFTHVDMTDDYLHEVSSLLGRAHAIFGAGRHPRPVTTNTTGWPCDDAAFRRWRTYFARIGQGVDIISVDVYPGLDRSQAAALPEALRGLGNATHKPVYVTEFGLQTAPGTNSQEDQARAYDLVLTSLGQSPTPVVIAYELRDAVSTQSGPPGFGVLTASGHPKPVASIVGAAMAAPTR